jgi:acyl-coenzyme A thioesterase PaaI-like protein
MAPDEPVVRAYPDAATFATPARLRLAASTRHLVDTVLTTFDASEVQLDAAATATDALVERLLDSDRAGRAGRLDAPSSAVDATPRPGRRHEDFVPRSPLVGPLNPCAPPFEWEFRDGELIARGVFTAAFEGPPGYVHGGYVALAFDEVLGIANVASGYGGLTGRLTVRYRRPTPLHTELRFVARVARADGRRLTTVGRVFDGETLTAEAEGLFVEIGPDRALEYFGERLQPPEPIDPLP